MKTITITLIMIVFLAGCCTNPKPKSDFVRQARYRKRAVEIAIIKAIRDPTWTEIEITEEIKYQMWLQEKRERTENHVTSTKSTR